MMPLATLDQLDQVPWANLDHAYGSAEDIPDMIRALGSGDPDARAQARGGLHASLDHQGVQRFESTFRAIPFLIGLLADPSTPDRGELARLLAELAVGDTCWFLHDGVHRERQMNVDDAARPQHASVIRGRDFATRGFPRLPDDRLDLSEGSGLRWIYDAVVAGVPTYLAALDGADEPLRAAIPFLCAFLTTDEAAAAAAPALERLLDDPSAAVRASAALGLSHATKFVPALWERAFATLSARWDREPGALERRGLALALVRCERPADTVAVRAYLRDELARGVPEVRPDDFPWRRIDSAPFVFCTTWIGTDAAERPALRAPGCAALATLTEPHDAADLGLWLVRLWLPPADGDAPTPGALDDAQRAVLAALVAAPVAWHFTDLGRELRDRGLPADREALAAWLADA
ncbi:MAG: hypothetical protein HS111_32560 [Kofleriaceae bacterium]|nr:hypothetical protein [Kofleriaceae bacterium]MCL4223363.1 hypothetical protein [Myxococcales bacterium]